MADQDVGKRTKRHFDFGERFGILVRNLMPIHAAPCALATCRIHIMGWRKGNHDGDAPRDSRNEPFRGQGRWVHTRMKTLAANVNNFVKKGPRARWSYADNFDAADTLLACFGGITVQEILDHYGNVGPDDRLELDLVEIVETLRPGLMQQTDPHAILTTALAGKLTA